jgi:hypothetical protein
MLLTTTRPGEEINEFPCAVVHEGGVLVLHSGLPVRCLGAGESNVVGFLLHTIAGGKESDGGRRRACWDVVLANNQVGHEGLFGDVLFGLALFRVTTRRDNYRRVFGHVSHKVAVAEGVRLKAGWAVGLLSGMRFGERGGSTGKGVERVGGEGCILGVVGVKGICDDRVNREARAEAWGVLMENNMGSCGDAVGLRDVDAVTRGIRWVANHDATERFFS